ncbi:MAG: type II toxin-antitoxin system RelE/ParE family toxin [Synergistaceae bacterium]|nr:type II toxin-antitoxin system RelE/ParE family toxin [Synergistaceae bacterium]MBQ6435222.1 type II toxin-antitoxin system RelE/ParE family toxin [Synergistaceae bacterium]MBR0254168.1 type II toxin-antitoxin system RelE/ParE family toxin [Synergistaceae bacterium]MBR0316404.1 type II toxin-antitoxin system RelE/ParE family toxin [Synergistaceae bacterium]
MWRVNVDEAVERRLKKIPNPDKKRIQHAIDILEYNPEILDIKPLIGHGSYRLRVGSWRLLMDIFEEEKIISVYMLGSRGDVYKK